MTRPDNYFRLDAVKALQTFVADRMEHNGVRPTVSAYGFLREGPRLSELSCVYGNGGCSWMRSDLDAAATVLAAEDFLIWHGEPVDRHEGMAIDLAQEAERGLAYQLAGDGKDSMEAMGEWEER